ncbi:hypothetical protein YC2023_053121 [Brassica napus]
MRRVPITSSTPYVLWPDQFREKEKSLFISLILDMAFLRSLFDTKQIIRQSLTTESSTPKGFLAVYVGENLKKKRFFVPVYYLSKPSFQALLRKAEEEFGFDHPTGGLSLPCDEAFFFTLTSQIR